LIYSDATSKAEGFLTAIKNHLLGLDKTSKFRSVYGSWEVDPKRGVWNQSAIVIKPRQQARAEPSIDTAGLETSKVGTHFDVIIFDDLVSDLNCTTKEQMEKVHECYKKALSLLKPGGEVLVVGTRWHFGDLYGRLLADNPKTKQFGIHIRKAEVDGTYPFESIGLTKEFLQQQRHNQGSYLWSCLYQNAPVDDETAIFKSTDFRFYSQRPTGLYITCAVDPAISENAGADQSAITVVGTDPQGDWYLLDIVAGRLLPDQVIEQIMQLHSHWHFQALGIETNAFQRMLKRDLERRIDVERQRQPNFHLFHIEGFTGTSANTKEMRIRALQPLHERGAIKFPGERLELLTGNWADLAYQMLQFPRAPHDDIVDSLAYHVSLYRKGSENQSPEDFPFSSAKWFEREWYHQQLKTRGRTPRWKRPSLPQLAFS
jgi:predicted phage terminase large subunit-like protein